ncbi:uncharacterized protein LOC109850156 [Asparagus officinalis]|uniref:uncharacterized protein LOC109850156 n=1 Tax=Asparagus officinalis TaxID=4686 RepID=UPI00098E3A9D|nr:uncharacterized protein LOC109850156 [Asparagus officinalis]
MVSLALYRGNLHRVSDAPRQWRMPPRAITLSQFRILTQKREKALARLAAAQKNPKKEEEEVEEVNFKEEEEEVEVKNPEVSQPQPIEVKVESKEAEDRTETIEASISASSAAKGPETATTTQVNNVDAAKEKRKIELEKKLEHLKQKKHHLVQMLKQILNAEEEIKRRNAQTAALRSSIPLQSETTVDMGSATRNVPKLSVEVNFSGDLAAESDATTNNSAQGHHMHQAPITSPSATSLRRPFQQNTFLSTPRSATSGHGQTPSNVFAGNNTAVATSSPSRFAPAGGNQGHHHSASLPPPVPGSHFMASSPSPAASGGASSAFRDARLTSSS